jgi:hypothetical protein
MKSDFIEIPVVLTESGVVWKTQNNKQNNKQNLIDYILEEKNNEFENYKNIKDKNCYAAGYSDGRIDAFIKVLIFINSFNLEKRK